MDDQKLENVLNLSLDATPEEREKSLVLEEGFFPATRQWELIVKYTGEIEAFAPYVVRAVPLLNEYAIVWIEEQMLEAFAALDEVEFIEQPKRLFFSAVQGKQASCIPPVQRPPLSLTGTGVLVAVIDSGVDIFNENFRKANGTTRILALWDQTARTVEENIAFASVGGILGRVYTETEINEILSENAAFARAPGEDMSGHGTAVLGIAAGSSAAYQGVATESALLVVKLGTPEPDGFPRTTQLMQGVDFAVRFALERRLPVAINLSFGNSYGPHNATALLSQYLDDLANYWKSVIVIGTGNEGAQAGHAVVSLQGAARSGQVRTAQNGQTGTSRSVQTGTSQNGQMGTSQSVQSGTSQSVQTGTSQGEQTVRLGVGMFEPGLNVQIWKSYVDEIKIAVVAPNSARYDIPVRDGGPHRARLGGTELLIFVGEPGPYSIDQEIFIDFLPTESYVDAGEWRFVFLPERIVDGTVNLWLPGGGVLGGETAFLNPAPVLTLTIPSTARRGIGVAAYDSRRDTAADFSGRGDAQVSKPDLAAPGVEIPAPTPGNGYAAFSGTSVAAPFVTGSAALLMEWGIVDGNDPYLYGEKVKAYLQRGARPLPGFTEYPNDQVGYGALCVREALPI